MSSALGEWNSISTLGQLQLTTIAIMQYIAPTLIFLVAVFVFGEEFGQARMIAFPMIWAALVIYSVSMFRKMRQK